MDNNIDDLGRSHGSKTYIINSKIIPLIDAHMHIQSNDIASIPIMKGIAYFNGLKIAASISLRNKINYHNLSFLDMEMFPEKDDISPGRFTTESMAGNLLAGIAGNTRRKITDTTAGFLSSLFVKDYGKIARHTSFNIANIYAGEVRKNTMAYSSRRLIIDINENKINYSEDEKGKKRRDNSLNKLIEKRSKTFNNFYNNIANYYYSFEGNINGIFEFSIVLGMELAYAHYWGAYGIPIYICLDNKMYYISNDLEYNTDISAREYNLQNIFTCYNAYDIPKGILDKNFKIINNKSNTQINHGSYRHASNTGFFTEKIFDNNTEQKEKYKHFLVPVDTNEIAQYESFYQHLEYTRMSTIKHPFKYLPFYHFDPRRFFCPEINTDLHEFYIKERFNKDNSLKIIDGEIIKKSINSKIPIINNMKIEELEEELLFDQKSETGLFWGVKMYAALGCPPYIYKEKNKNIIFKSLKNSKINKNRNYLKLKNFYQNCAKNKIPIICHCSPQGMVIADPCIYLKEYLKDQKKSKYYNKRTIHFPPGKKQYLAGIGLIDDFSSPDGWDIVLNDIPELKLCLAHYGGSDFIKEELNNDPEKSPYCWYKNISKLIKKYDQVYTDISNYSVGEPPDLLEEISRNDFRAFLNELGDLMKKIYKENRSGVFIYNKNVKLSIEEENIRNKIRLEMIKKNPKHFKYKQIFNIANNLAIEIKINPKLRYRIMFGTDWPMSEMKVKGIAYYSSSMFIILQLLTDILLNEHNIEFDAWHQFVVINPLRFLGMLEENISDPEYEKNKEELNFIFNKMTKFKENIIEYLKNIPDENQNKYEKMYNVNFEEEGDMLFIDNCYSILNMKYSNVKIPTAHSKYVKNNKNELIILKNNHLEDAE